MKTFLILIFFIWCIFSNAQSPFFCQYWAEFDPVVNNNKLDPRTRVNNKELSVHPAFYSRPETQANGLAMIQIPDTIIHLERAELYCELWGGHQGTANKRFQINGRRTYSLPGLPTEENNLEYRFPIVPIDYKELVRGNNAIQFAFDRGISFWGHFILDEIAVNCYLKSDAPILEMSGLNQFKAIPVVANKILTDRVNISLSFSSGFQDQISAVHYFGRYAGYDASGSGVDEQWHGYQFKRRYTGHIGTATEPLYVLQWDTRMIPDQSVPMALRALIEFRNGVFCWSDILEGLTFPPDRPRVLLYYCRDLPKPFHSRENSLQIAWLELPGNLSGAETAELHLRIWDGGEGTVKEPFTLNGIPYRVTAGDAPHDLIC